jgi:hypothetical protein
VPAVVAFVVAGGAGAVMLDTGLGMGGGHSDAMGIDEHQKKGIWGSLIFPETVELYTKKRRNL